MEDNGCERDTTTECIVSNACYGVAERYGGKDGAIRERILTNAIYGVGDGDGGKGGTTPERIVFNACVTFYHIRSNNIYLV